MTRYISGVPRHDARTGRGMWNAHGGQDLGNKGGREKTAAAMAHSGQMQLDNNITHITHTHVAYRGNLRNRIRKPELLRTGICSRGFPSGVACYLTA